VYTKEEIRDLVKTASKGGTVGTSPTVVTQWVAKLGWKGQRVLDYGCGPMEFQTAYLKRERFIVTPYDFDYPRSILSGDYDILGVR
jgi:hypothetical protein